MLPPGHVQRTSLSTSVRTVAAFARSDETTYAVWFAVIANRTVPSATTLWSIPDFGGGGPVTRFGVNVTDEAAEARTGGQWPVRSPMLLISALDLESPE
ncbi:hypothetical protein GCM10029978_117280 [Actinoallomurus acanthiterrae]